MGVLPGELREDPEHAREGLPFFDGRGDLVLLRRFHLGGQDGGGTRARAGGVGVKILFLMCVLLLFFGRYDSGRAY